MNDESELWQCNLDLVPEKLWQGKQNIVSFIRYVNNSH